MSMFVHMHNHMCAYVPWQSHGDSVASWYSLFPLSAMWKLKIELRLLGLAAEVFTHSLSPFFIEYFIYLHFKYYLLS